MENENGMRQPESFLVRLDRTSVLLRRRKSVVVVKPMNPRMWEGLYEIIWIPPGVDPCVTDPFHVMGTSAPPGTDVEALVDPGAFQGQPTPQAIFSWDFEFNGVPVDNYTVTIFVDGAFREDKDFRVRHCCDE